VRENLLEDKEMMGKIENAIWVAKSLYDRNKTAGSSANLSFRYKDKVVVTSSGTCFGRLTKNDFTLVDMDGNILDDSKPSKELPLHLAVYRHKKEVNAVIHTHSFYSVLLSCCALECKDFDCIPTYTPYLKMKLGTVGLVPYAPPGSEKLFEEFEKRVDLSDGYLLRNHGPVIPGKNMMATYYSMEEMEESAHVAWELRKSGVKASKIEEKEKTYR
jgi:L-ribulose-5-phosphate 4-epimerase